jgi:hypothetical protein
MARMIICAVGISTGWILIGCGDLTNEKSSGAVTVVPAPNNDSTNNNTNSSNNTNSNLNLDSDLDGLSDTEEALYGTDPNNANTDNDDQQDGYEINHPQTRNPLNADDDVDGVDGAPGSTGLYASGLTFDCNNEDGTIYPGALDSPGTPDKNCGPDLAQDSLVIRVNGSSTVTYTVDVTMTSDAGGIYIHAYEGFPGGYECEYNNLAGAPINADFGCSTWNNPPIYMQGVPIGFHVVKMGPKTYMVEARAKTCFNCTTVVSDYQSEIFGE